VAKVQLLDKEFIPNFPETCFYFPCGCCRNYGSYNEWQPHFKYERYTKALCYADAGKTYESTELSVKKHLGKYYSMPPKEAYIWWYDIRQKSRREKEMFKLREYERVKHKFNITVMTVDEAWKDAEEHFGPAYTQLPETIKYIGGNLSELMHSGPILNIMTIY